jgi:mannose-6-phosphate isomerase-like protein (cupin superfamily)
MRLSLALALALSVIGASVRPAVLQHTPNTPQPLILQADDGEHLVRRSGPTEGWPYLIKLDPQQGNTQDFFVMAEVMAPGQSIPFHKHHNAEEILVLEEGGASVVVGTRKARAGPRSIAYIPRDTWVSAKNTSSHEIHLTAIFSRHGFDTYMRAISVKPGAPLTALTAEELTRLRAAGHATYWDASQGASPPGIPAP